MTRICGIDEAGKGPVIGDLVVVGCVAEGQEALRRIGAKDSKMLTRKQRENLFDEIKNNVTDFNIVRISALEIDERNAVGCNLNTLECLKMAQIINTLMPEKVFIDCPHPVPEKFRIELLKYLNDKNVEIIAEHRADSKYPLVGAASIIAKVTRDNHIKELENELGIIIGSGYPSDPATKKVLDEEFENKGLEKYIRHSWDTYKRMKIKKGQKSLFEET